MYNLCGYIFPWYCELYQRDDPHALHALHARAGVPEGHVQRPGVPPPKCASIDAAACAPHSAYVFGT